MDMHRIEVIGYRGNSIWAKLINTFSEYSHVAILIDGLDVVDTDLGRGVSRRPLSWKRSKYDIRKTYILDADEYEIVKKYIQDYNGVGYSVYEGLRFVFYKVFNIRLKDDIRKPNCVEFTQNFLINLDFISSENVHIPMSPDEFIEYVVLDR